MWSTTYVVNCPLAQSGICLTVTQGKVNSYWVCTGSNYKTALIQAIWEQVWRSFHFQLLLKHVSCQGCCILLWLSDLPLQEELIIFAKNAMTSQLLPAWTGEEAMTNTFEFSCFIIQGHMHKELAITYQLQICNTNQMKSTKENILVFISSALRFPS